MTVVLTVLHVMVCLFLIGMVLLQRGKGAEIGAVFGGGASNTVFGSRGAGNFLTKATTGAAILFMATSLWLAVLGKERVSETLFGEEEPAATQEAAPVASPFVEAPVAPTPGQAPPPAP